MTWWTRKQKKEEDQFKEANIERAKWQKFYVSKQWRELRLHKLAEQPLCEHCIKDGIIEPAYHVDHVLPIALRPDLKLSYDNLQCLCARHHSIKTTTTDRYMKIEKRIEDNMNELNDFD